MCQKAELAEILGTEKFSATDVWFNRWKKHKNIVYKSVYGAEMSADIF
jgi:hypothetical protein